VGENLSKVTDLCQMYGSLELGQVQLLVPQKGEWSYLELNPFEEADMQPTGDGIFEMVLHQESQLAARRSLWHNFPDVKLWRTGDLFIPHHTKPGLWRFHSRIDDLIVFSSSHKLRPLEMETILHGNPLIAGALIVGQGRPEPLLIVEPKFGVYEGDPESLINGIWSSVQEANNIAPTYAKLRRSRVMIATPDKPFIRAPKGSIVRKLTIQLYIDNIEAAYTDGPLHHKDNENPRLSLRSFILPGVKAFICSCIEEHIPKDLLSEVDNFFLRGLDSLGAAAFSRKLGMGLENGPQYPIRVGVSLQTINKYPTVNGLAATIVNSMLNHGEILFSSVQDTRKLEATVVEFTENLSPYPYTTSTVESLKADSGLNVVLIGPRGSLGPHILRNLLQRTSVNEIYCLNRGNDGREKLQNAFTAQGLPLLSESENSRVHFMAIALGEPRLGLCRDDYATLLENADIIIHNAWKVNFSWTLEAYKPEYIHSVRAVIDLATTSPSRPRIVFISSISSVQAWAAVIQSPVPERQLEGPDSYRVASPLGYGQSKHVSEKILVQASIKSGIPVTILRVGQVAGSTRDTGSPWSTDEWIPSLAAISKTLRLIPLDIPPIDWIPVDIVGQVISELTLSSNEDKKKVLQSAPLKVFNVVNPHLTDWSVFVDVLRARIGENAKLVALVEWVHSSSITDPKAMSTAEATASTKILPFFQHLADTAATGAALQPKFETTSTVTGSPTMARVQAIDKRLIDLWCQQWGV
jgi:thioester reductase-like protein